MYLHKKNKQIKSLILFIFLGLGLILFSNRTLITENTIQFYNCRIILIQFEAT